MRCVCLPSLPLRCVCGRRLIRSPLATLGPRCDEGDIGRVGGIYQFHSSSSLIVLTNICDAKALPFLEMRVVPLAGNRREFGHNIVLPRFQALCESSKFDRCLHLRGSSQNLLSFLSCIALHAVADCCSAVVAG